MVREYSKYECEICHATFYDIESAESHERLCMDEEFNLQEARKLLHKCYRTKGEFSISFYKIIDAYLDLTFQPVSVRRRVILGTLCISVFQETIYGDEVKISGEELSPEDVSSMIEISDSEFSEITMDCIRRTIEKLGEISEGCF